MKPLPRSFYARDAATVARALLGKILIHQLPAQTLRARIVETEAYVGSHDLACHASKGRTPRTEVMFGPAGHAYVYLIYGMYQMLNIVTGPIHDAQAVLLRAAQPLDDFHASLSGPGKLARALAITRAHNGIDLTRPPLFLIDDHFTPAQILTSPRIGVDYAEHWKDEHLRFFIPGNPHVSRAKKTPRSSPPRQD